MKFKIVTEYTPYFEEKCEKLEANGFKPIFDTFKFDEYNFKASMLFIK